MPAKQPSETRIAGRAAVAELVDAPDSSPGVREDVWVRLPPAAWVELEPIDMFRRRGRQCCGSS